MTTHDPADLIETLRITKVEQRNAGGSWVRGTLGGHRFNALIFPEHAENPEWELGDSRISKLWVQRISDRAVVAYFERGWDLRPRTEAASQIVDLLAGGLAEMVLD
jgi:hypothetical protein